MRDVEPAEFPPTRFPRVDARHSRIWVRVGGVWREGLIRKWVHERTREAHRWLVWGEYRDDRPGSGWAPGWWVYDPATIRPRDEDEPPEG